MYGKVFTSLFNGSMFGAGAHVFAVWMYVLAFKDADQMVELNPVYMAAVLGCTVDIVEDAIRFLSSPDPRSRTQKEDGKRVIPGNRPMLWYVVNGEYYDKIRNSDDRRRINTAPAEPFRADDDITPRGYVYYIGEPNGRIKIGFSGNPWARLNDLRVGVPDAELLAVEVGSRNDERARHEQFASLRTGGEWFVRSPELEAHVAKLAAMRSATGRKRSTTPVATGVATVATVAPSIDIDIARDTRKDASKTPQDRKTISTHEKAAPRKRVARLGDPSPLFEEAWKTYPKRPNNSKAAAWRQWKARTAEGVDELQMLGGTKAYATHVEAEGTDPRFVKQAATFYGRDRHFEAGFDPVPHTPSDDDLLRRASPEMRARIARIESIAAEDAAEEKRTEEFLASRPELPRPSNFGKSRTRY